MHDEKDNMVRSVASWKENMTDFIVLSVLFGSENHSQPSTTRMPHLTSLVEVMENRNG